MRLLPPRSRFTALGFLLAAGTAALAAPVTATQAGIAAGAWLQRTPRPLETALHAGLEGIESHVDTDGRILYHQVKLEGGGFLVLAPDDTLEPVIAFAAQGSLDPDPENHLFIMLQRDLRTRLDVMVKARDAKGPGGVEAAATKAQSRWKNLLGTSEVLASSVASVSDVRVAPLVGSTWNQGKAGGKVTFNYFTPSNSVCGCVATSMAQLMRFHQWPTAGIGVKSFKVTVDSVSQTLNTRGGDGQGGPYAWASMPLRPSTSTTDAERQMIGSLCYDAGLSVNMSYTSTSSGANALLIDNALRDTFKFANAINGYRWNGTDLQEMTGNGLTRMVQPNLDAGYPVLLGIEGDGGHSIVCDGYGYNGTTIYHHLNLGWGGSEDAWYNLPAIGTDYNFNLIDLITYNVFPQGAGEILSGRVTDGSGTPVAGVTVTDGILSSTTGATGIYALKGIAPGTTTVTAAKTGLAFPQAVLVHEDASQDGATTGNLWGVDLVQGAGATPVFSPQPVAQSAKLGGSATFSAGAIGLGPLHFQWTKNGTAVGTDSPVYTLAAAEATDDQAAIGLKVTGSQGAADSVPVPLTVVRLFNGDFEYGNKGWDLWNNTVVLADGDYAEVTPRGGAHWLCIGDWSTPCTDYAMQDIELPASGSMDLAFWAGVANKASTPAAATNIFKVMVLDTGGNTLATLKTLDNTSAAVDGTGKVVWVPYGPYSLAAWKGQTVRLRIESVQPGATNTGTVFAIDDVTLTQGASGPVAALAQGPRTIATGGQASFSATVTGFTADNGVDWTVSPAYGTFSAARTAGDGTATLFTAGAAAGTCTVTATPVETGAAASTTLALVDPSTVTVGLAPLTPTAVLGQGVTFASTVTPLTDASVTWTATGGTFSATGGTTATWSSASPGTYTVTATSNGAPSRSASTTVQVVDLGALALAVTPPAATLRPGGTATFTASGDLGFGVNWTLTAPATHADAGLASTVTAPAAVPLVTTTYTLTAAHKLAPAVTATAVVTVKGLDLDGDGALGLSDLLAFAGQWGKNPASPANFKGSGAVDDTDLATLLTQLQ
ncbi:MAG: hypothetical protein HGA66_02460 [Holophaga sp.]|nr:hypothetical protein [Holophaga sp.]